MYSTSMSFDSIFVIQSLAAGERRTGENLLEGTLRTACERESVYAELVDVHDRAELLGTLSRILRETRNRDLAPIIHLEAHGDPEGIELSGAPGDIVPWADLAPLLTEINEACRMNLLVVAAMCHGIHILDILRPVDRAPAFAILGARRRLDPETVQSAMQVFYWTFLQPPHDLGQAFASIPDGGTESDFHIINAELWMCHIFREYFAREDPDESEEQRVARLLEQLLPPTPLVTDSMALRDSLRQRLRDHEVWFEHYRTKFLMLDLFPGERVRFGWSYRDCLNAAT